MTNEITLEIGRARCKDGARDICRLSINGERRGKLSLTHAEALKLARILRTGCAMVPPLMFILRDAN